MMMTIVVWTQRTQIYSWPRHCKISKKDGKQIISKQVNIVLYNKIKRYREYVMHVWVKWMTWSINIRRCAIVSLCQTFVMLINKRNSANTIRIQNNISLITIPITIMTFTMIKLTILTAIICIICFERALAE